MRSRNFCSDALVWKRQPLAVTISSTPRSTQAWRSSSSSRRSVSASTSSSNIFLSSATGSGSWAASSAASSTIFISFGLSIGEFHVNGSEGLQLGHFEKTLPGQLQNRQKIDDQHRNAPRRLEQLAELGEPAAPQLAQDERHVLPHRQLLPADPMVLRHFRTHEQRAPRFLEVDHVDLRQALDKALLDPDLHRQEIPPELGERVELLAGELHLLVLEQAPHQLGARILLFLG